MNFTEFFTNISMMDTFFWIGVVATPFFLGLMLMSFFGMEGDVEMDADVDMDMDTDSDGLHFFTFRNFATFFTLFAWVGYYCQSIGMGMASTIILSTISGTALVAAMMGILSFAHSLRRDYTGKLSDAIGQTATVYLVIPDGGRGKVTVNIAGAPQQIDAVSKDGEIKTGRPVKVTGATDSELIVESTMSI